MKLHKKQLWQAYCAALGRKPKLSDGKNFHRWYVEMYQYDPTIESTEDAVCKVFDVGMTDIRGKRRYRNIVDARHMLFYALYEMGYGPTFIGKKYGYDHTTVCFVYGGQPGSMPNKMKYDGDLRTKYQEVRRLAKFFEATA